VTVIDKLILSNDLPEQAFVGGTNKSASGFVDLREELPRKWNERPPANVDKNGD
jgi:hypothetical protein